MVDGMMSSAFAAAAAAHQDSLSRMTSMTNSIAPPQSHATHTAGQILGEYMYYLVLNSDICFEKCLIILRFYITKLA